MIACLRKRLLFYRAHAAELRAERREARAADILFAARVRADLLRDDARLFRARAAKLFQRLGLNEEAGRSPSDGVADVVARVTDPQSIARMREGFVEIEPVFDLRFRGPAAEAEALHLADSVNREGSE